MQYERSFKNFAVSTERERLDFNVIHTFLSSSYWAQGISRETLRVSLEHSLCFGLYDGTAQVGFCRVITDYARFAYLGDVFVLAPHRGQGLAQWLCECALAHPAVRDIPRWSLKTRDAHSLYERLGFKRISNADWYMDRVSTTVA